MNDDPPTPSEAEPHQPGSSAADSDRAEGESDAAKSGSRVELFLAFGWPGASELRALLPMDEEMFIRVSGIAHPDGRAYILYGALDEVEKALMQLMRLQDWIEGKRADPGEDRLSRLAITHIVEEERARARRLIELLVLLVLFETTNENPYYQHLIAVEELRDHLYHNLDLEEFHGARSANVDYSVHWTTERVIERQKEIDIRRAWYLQNRVRLSSSPRLSPRKLSRRLKAPSMRDLIKAALPLMSAHEKIHFGTSYDEAYSHPSESVHFGVIPNAHSLGEDADVGGATRVGLLAMNILDRVHRLLGRPSAPLVEKIVAGLAHPRAPEYLFMWTQREIEVGDFVLAGRHLAEVLEIQTSDFGNRSYRIRFLAERPIPDILEDWYQARYVYRLYNRGEVLRKLDRFGDKLPPAVVALMRSARPEELQLLLREIMPTVWKSGLREWALARFAATSQPIERPAKPVAAGPADPVPS